MNGDELGDSEEIVRAVPTAKFSAKKQRVSAQVFVDRDGASVSRTSILPYGELLKIFKADLHHPPDNPLYGTLSLTVGQLRGAVENPPAKPPITAVVIEDRIEPGNERGDTPNPAHALVFGSENGVRQKLTEGQSNRVLKVAKLEIVTEEQLLALSGSHAGVQAAVEPVKESTPDEGEGAH